MIPKRIHFIYGLSENFADIPFAYVHYLAIRSAKVVNPDCEVVIHYYYAPQNEWWERSKQFATFVKFASPPPDTIHEKVVQHNAHKADLLRVEILLAEGGIYLDIDTLCIKPFAPLMDKPYVMGVEIWEGQITGLCNAVIFSEAGNEFLRMWYDEFSDFRPDHWNFMACVKPFHLCRKYPKLIWIEPSESFFRLTWSDKDLDTAHKEVIPYTRSYSMHLWESASYKRYLKQITEDDVLHRDSTFNLLARKILI